MRIVGRHGPIHHLVKRPCCRAIGNHYVFRSPARHEHQLLKPVELRPFPNPRARKVAVIGGGVTGLTAAFQLARTIPDAQITIYEKADRLGGWLNSEIIEVDEGEVLFEWGPRTLRPDMSGAGLATVELLGQLGILDKAICLSKSHPAATNRFVYYPDRLVRMPGPNPSSNRVVSAVRNLYAAFTEPIFGGVVSSLIAEPTVAPRPRHVQDESLGDFLRRRFGPQIADNLASAVIHGIYAGDLYKLSARTLMPMLWYAETRDPDGNGVMAEFADLFFKNLSLRRLSDVEFHNLTVKAQDVPKDDFALTELLNHVAREASVYTFARGTSVLSERLCEVLEENPNVTIRTGAGVHAIKYDDQAKNITIVADADSGTSASYDYVVSTLSPGHLGQQLLSENGVDGAVVRESAFDAVNVMVVNLYYSSPDLITPDHQGFGYLLPRSVPIDQNPERALGVIFGSETSGIRGQQAVQKIPKISAEALADAKAQVDTLTAMEKDPEQAKFHHAIKVSLDSATKFYELAQQEANGPDEKIVRVGQDTAPGTKLTVMLGGHWWNGWQDSDLPSEEEAIDMAKSVVARHLKVMEVPLVAKARMNKNCIPQYPVGYRQNMSRVHDFLLDKFQGRLKVAGPWWQGGVGVNDCVRKARLTAFAIREEWDDKTGLEEYTQDEKYVLFDRRTGMTFMDPLQSS